ncbi:hypothetical protein BASA81_000614 [Batrachochytrium salamandrivorans]|nr:hypothetical protein BASA81_000614 [Batrachochytrium salamandrivorans]
MEGSTVFCLGKSFDNVRAFASEFVVDGNRLLLTAADEEANFRVWALRPEGQFLQEKVFRRLDLLQQAMVASALIPRNAGLHPLQCSQPRVPKRPSHSKTLRNATATIVDGRILHKFVDLEKITQIKLAMSIGSTVESILDTLLEISLVSVW